MFLPQHVQRMQTATMLLGSMSPPQQQPSSPVQDTPTRMPLKFGMDRILSEDIAPRRRADSGSPSSSPLRSPGVPYCLHEDGTRVCSEGGGVPCSECVSSLPRCCSVSAANTPLAPTPTYFYPSLHHLTASYHGAPPPHFASMFTSDSSHLIHPHASKPSTASSNNSSTPTSAGGKRKRSWSRAVFSNLQRKGLEKRFQLQKYITKPDRRQLAATLGLTDAQVKVWFQNRRMKWRHSKEAKQQAVAVQPADSRGPGSPSAVNVEDVEAARRAADSTQLSSDLKTDDESDIDIEVDS